MKKSICIGLLAVLLVGILSSCELGDLVPGGKTETEISTEDATVTPAEQEKGNAKKNDETDFPESEARATTTEKESETIPFDPVNDTRWSKNY